MEKNRDESEGKSAQPAAGKRLNFECCIFKPCPILAVLAQAAPVPDLGAAALGEPSVWDGQQENHTLIFSKKYNNKKKNFNKHDPLSQFGRTQDEMSVLRSNKNHCVCWFPQTSRFSPFVPVRDKCTFLSSQLLIYTSVIPR